MQDQQLDAIEFFDVPAAHQRIVREWYGGRVAALALDGERSVHLPHPDGGGRVLKLKGAGLAGGPVQFGTYHRTGPKAPVFDFDGRMMEDVAAGHDGAFAAAHRFSKHRPSIVSHAALSNWATKPCRASATAASKRRGVFPGFQSSITNRV